MSNLFLWMKNKTFIKHSLRWELVQGSLTTYFKKVVGKNKGQKDSYEIP